MRRRCREMGTDLVARDVGRYSLRYVPISGNRGPGPIYLHNPPVFHALNAQRSQRTSANAIQLAHAKNSAR